MCPLLWPFFVSQIFWHIAVRLQAARTDVTPSERSQAARTDVTPSEGSQAARTDVMPNERSQAARTDVTGSKD